jgi:hypothetical protein
MTRKGSHNIFQNGAIVEGMIRRRGSVIPFLLANGLSEVKIHRQVLAVFGANYMTFKGVSH